MNTGFMAAIRQSGRQIWRNKAMAFASFFSISAILLILGIFFIIVVNVNYMTTGIRDSFNTVEVHLLDETTIDQANEMIAQLEQAPGVESAVYRSKEENLEHWKERWGDNADVLDRLLANPLPNTIQLTLSDITKTEAVVKQASEMPGTDKINYAGEAVTRIIKIAHVVQIVAIVLIILLVIISIIVVSNTIKLTVLAREREIRIMKYVGATNWFIRGPFLIEGIMIGVASALISGGIVAALYEYIIGRFGLAIITIMQSGLVPFGIFAGNMFIIFAAIGVSIGACGSIISMRRFLDT
jgi:cell division transport system permease protein